jgi:hypothetical protein
VLKEDAPGKFRTTGPKPDISGARKKIVFNLSANAGQKVKSGLNRDFVCQNIQSGKNNVTLFFYDSLV